MRFCCFKLSKNTEKRIKQAADMHTDWPSATGYEILLEMRFEVVHVYFAQHCFFIPLPHVLVGIQNAAATSKKQQQQKKTACIREIQVRKLWTKVYSQKWLTAIGVAHSWCVTVHVGWYMAWRVTVHVGWYMAWCVTVHVGWHIAGV